jgi:putative MFS transporter
VTSRIRKARSHAGVGGVFGLITSAMIVVIVANATFGPNVLGKPLDAF